MTRVSEPFVRLKCDDCGHVYERQVGQNTAKAEVDRIDDERPHKCGQCEYNEAAGMAHYERVAEGRA